MKEYAGLQMTQDGDYEYSSDGAVREIAIDKGHKEVVEVFNRLINGIEKDDKE